MNKKPCVTIWCETLAQAHEREKALRERGYDAHYNWTLNTEPKYCVNVTCTEAEVTELTSEFKQRCVWR